MYLGNMAESNPIQKFMLLIFAIINGSSVMYSGKKPQHDFPKMGVKGRLEFFRKFIRFGGAIRPLGKTDIEKKDLLSGIAQITCVNPKRQKIK